MSSKPSRTGVFFVKSLNLFISGRAFCLKGFFFPLILICHASYLWLYLQNVYSLTSLYLKLFCLMFWVSFFCRGYHCFVKWVSFWLCWVFITVPGFLALWWVGGTLWFWCMGSCCGAWSSVVAALTLSSCGFGCSEACGSSQTSDGTHFPCIGRWILNTGTTREIQWVF